MHPVLHIGLLNNFRLTYGDVPVTRVDTPRQRSLLAYLLLHRSSPQIRQHVAFTFWPDSTEKQALTNLRHLLYDLRRALPEADRFLRADNRVLVWRHDAPFTLDVVDFEFALTRAEDATQRADRATVREALENAADYYQGDLLPDCYDAWIEPERERLRQASLRTLERLVRLLEDQRDYDAAIHYARRLLQQDRLRETSYAALMRLQALRGNRAGALQVYADCVDVLQRELKVAPGPVVHQLYERLLNLQAPLRAHAATQPTHPAPALPLIGRHEEWAKLKAEWRTATREQARFVVVKGEAGTGKTRLVEELLSWAARQGITTAKTRSYAAEGRLAYAPVTDWLRTDALFAVLSRLSIVWMTEISRLLPELRLEHPELPEPKPVRESWQRLRLFEALSRAVLAGGSPLLIMLDDMQWTDVETLSWLRYLMRFAPAAQLLVAGTIRHEEMDAAPALTSLLADLRRDGVLTEITLGPLDSTETAALASHVAGRTLLETEALPLYAETEGNPLFVVEMVRAGMLDEPSRVASLPPKVHAVITSRLAQLSPEARTLTNLAATIGHAFTVDVLTEASGRDEEHLIDALDELWRCHLVRVQSPGIYDFSHDKLREVTYHQISPARRRLLHRRIAWALATVHAEDLDAVSGQLAMHHEQAGQTAEAIRCYHRAGQLAKDMHANEEAIRLFRKALALLEPLPHQPEHDEKRLALQLALGTCLVALQGYGVAEARQVYEQAHALCEQIGRPQEAPILRALANASLTTGHLRRAYALGEAIRHLARNSKDPVLDVEAHYTLGVTSFWMGRFALSLRHLKKAIHYYNPQQHGLHIMLYAQDPKVVCLCRLGRTLWYHGYPEQAIRKTVDSLSLAQVLGHPYSRAYALWTAGHFYLDLGDLDKARECVDVLLPLATEQGFSLWEWYGTALRGALLAAQGKFAAGIASLQAGIKAWGDGGGSLSISQYQGHLASAYQKEGAVEEGRTALDKGFALVQTGERFYEAELYRIKGELLLAEDADAIQAAACFHRAMEVAQRHEARSLALRAAMSLGRLRHRLGETKQARHLLQDVYDAFTEGFDTPDLKEARSLLDGWS